MRTSTSSTVELKNGAEKVNEMEQKKREMKDRKEVEKNEGKVMERLVVVAYHDVIDADPTPPILPTTSIVIKSMSIAMPHLHYR